MVQVWSWYGNACSGHLAWLCELFCPQVEAPGVNYSGIQIGLCSKGLVPCLCMRAQPLGKDRVMLNHQAHANQSKLSKVCHFMGREGEKDMSGIPTFF